MAYDCLVFYSSPKELFFQPLQQHHCIASIIRSLFAREPPSAIALWTRLGDAVASYWCGTLYYAVGASSLGSLSWPTSPIGTRIKGIVWLLVGLIRAPPQQFDYHEQAPDTILQPRGTVIMVNQCQLFLKLGICAVEGTQIATLIILTQNLIKFALFIRCPIDEPVWALLFQDLIGTIRSFLAGWK